MLNVMVNTIHFMIVSDSRQHCNKLKIRENTKVYLSHYIKNINHIIEAIKILNFEGWKKTLGLSEVILIMIKIRGRLNIHQYIVQNGSIGQVIQMKLILKTLKRKKATIN